ncbi:MAG: hypothetical protein K0S98_262 [Propionibacteriaceae bacterium]|nr:hypothetical protein [Propionibacteriaceae bacterium]
METLHPSKADPNNSAAAFQEYAASTTWTIVHIGQFFAALLVALALVVLARSLTRQGGVTGALAVVGGASAILVAAIFAVQMAVDGVVLKATIDTWNNATQAADKSSAYQVAEATRWLEKALSAFFHLANGTTLLILGLAIAFGRGYPGWLGWVGAASALGFLTGGVVTAYTGFSPLAGTVLLGPASSSQSSYSVRRYARGAGATPPDNSSTADELLIASTQRARSRRPASGDRPTNT